MSKNVKLSLTKTFFREINSSNSFSKSIVFTKYLSNECESKFPQFSHCLSDERRNFWWKIFREVNSLENSKVKPLISRNFCQKMRERISVSSPCRLWITFDSIKELNAVFTKISIENRIPSSVEITEISSPKSHCGIYDYILRNFYITTFWKISVKVISLVKSLDTI